MQEHDFGKILFDLRAKIPGRRDIRLLGIFHAVNERSSRPAKDEEYLKKALSKHRGLIFSEDFDKKYVRAFVPQDFVVKTQPLENPLIGLIGQLAGIQQPSSLLESLSFNRYSTNRFIARESELMVLKKPKTRQQELKFVKKFIGRKGKSPEFRFKSNVRSVFMAAEALKQSRLENQDLAVVVGVFHANQMHRFITDPKATIAYLSMIKPQVEIAVESSLARKSTFAEEQIKEKIKESIKLTPLRTVFENAMNEFKLLLKPEEEQELRQKGYLPNV